MGQPLLPDVPNWSWHEYGMRAGFWRQFKALTDRNMPVTLAINANVCSSYPRVASAALEAGFEFMGHGFVQGPMHRLDPMRSNGPSKPSANSQASRRDRGKVRA
jgi:allantoinase